MAIEKWTEERVLKEEISNLGSSWTRNKFFDDNGYLILKKLCHPEKLFSEVPDKKGTTTYWGNKLSQYDHDNEEHQVEGSTARYWYPKYRQTHSKIRKVIEDIIGRKLYNTYYYERFYSSGQELWKHLDRPPCEISVSVHVGTNLKEEWPFYFKTPDKYTDPSKKELLKKGKKVSVNLNAGDGVVYKGCERPHWRDRMPGSYEEMNGHEKIYYHQIFFHYVLQDGIRAHYAFDRG